MKKIICLSLVSALAFFVGRQGADVPNEKAAFISKLEFASSLNKAFAAGPEEDAGKMAEGMWAFAIESQPSGDPSVYEFLTEMLDDISNEMQAQGYAACSDVPTSGSDLLPSGVTVSYSLGSKLIPTGSNWDNSGISYSKRMTASVGGNEFAELQYDCNTDLNIYFKFDFNQFHSHDRIAEFYVQKGSGNKLSLEMISTCTDAADGCGVKQNTAMSFHTPDGNEIKVVGTRTQDDVIDEVKSISLHGNKSLKIADIHVMDHADLANLEDIDPANASVTGACVDFNQATYIPPGGVADCTNAGVSANNALVSGESDAFSLGNIRPATVNAISLTY